MDVTRRALLGTLAATAAVAQTRKVKSWKPRLGVLGRYSEANVEFARQQGFTCMQFDIGRSLPPDASDELIAKVKDQVGKAGIHVSSLITTVNHTAPDLAERAAINANVVKTIELAGKLGVPYVGTMSGNMPGRKLQDQVDEIVRVYTEKYFSVCEKHGVKMIWEPWPGGPNIATGPVGYEALFAAFHDSPYVGLLYDPSHLVWQMMDPIQCARDFVDKIYDVHLKDTEIRWNVLRKTGIHPLNHAQWWRYRLPGSGYIDWKAFFTVLEEVGYQGTMNIEQEDPFYGPGYEGDNFTEPFKEGFRLAQTYLRQYVAV